MTKSIYLVLALMITSIMISCNSDTATKEDTTEDTAVVEEEHSTVLELNDGEKWKANPETTEGVNNMVKLVNDFVVTDDQDTYTNLNDSLNKEFTTIFKKCTMKGEAHNQLHNFLLPMVEMFKKLESEDVQEETLDHLKEHLSTYPTYFE